MTNHIVQNSIFLGGKDKIVELDECYWDEKENIIMAGEEEVDTNGLLLFWISKQTSVQFS